MLSLLDEVSTLRDRIKVGRYIKSEVWNSWYRIDRIYDAKTAITLDLYNVDNQETAFGYSLIETHTFYFRDTLEEIG